MIANITKGLLKRKVIEISRGYQTKAVKPKGLYPYYYPWLVVAPEKRIPYAEKVFWGLFISAGVLSVPVWVLMHMEEYRGGWDNQR